MKQFTPYRAIIHDSGELELSVIKYKGEWLQDLCLTWGPLKPKKSKIWDNPEYVVALWRELKNKRKGERIKAFKKQCKKRGLDFEQTREDFLDMMKEAKREGMWS